MQVDYIDKMGSDLTVVNAARVSYAKTKELMDAKDEKLIKFLAEHNHWSPFGHASIQFRIKAPIFVGTKFQEDTLIINLNCLNQSNGEADHKIQNKDRTVKLNLIKMNSLD